MPSPAARFARDAPEVAAAEPLLTGPSVHVYAGSLATGPEDVRIVTPAPDADAETRTQVENALETWTALAGHPAISAVRERGAEPRPWLAVTAAGRPLPELVPLSVERARLVLADVAEATRHARSAGHDVPVEPADVRVLEGGTGARLDWPVDPDRGSGSSPYAPPARERATADRGAVFRLGALAHEAVTGGPPGDAPPPGDGSPVADAPSSGDGCRADGDRVRSDVPDGFARVLARALDPDPSGRYESPYEFKRALLFEAGETDASPGDECGIGPSEPGSGDGDGAVGSTGSGDGGVGGTDGEDAPDGPGGAGRNVAVSRRGLLGALGLGGLSVAAGGVWFATRTVLGSETLTFPQFRYDAANTGYVPDAAGPTDGVAEQWSVDTGAPVISSPVVDEEVLVVGNNDDTYFALDPADGDERWSVDTSGPGFYSAAIGDRVAYLNGGGPGGEGTVSALTLREGEQHWTATRRGLGAGTPTFVGGRLYAPAEEAIYALDADGGDELWVAEDAATTSLSLAVDDDRVYYCGAIANEDEPELLRGVVALARDDGGTRWTFEMDGFVASSPAVRDGTVYVGSGQASTVYALDADGGEERWGFETDGAVISSPAVTAEAVYAGSEDGHVYAIDAEEGDERWRFEADGPVISSPAVTAEAVYVGSEDGHVYAIDAEEGDERWRFEAGGPVASSPAVTAEAVYVGSEDGHVYALGEPE